MSNSNPNIYEKLQNCRVELQQLKLKKSGENKFAKFKYYELADFLPSVNELFQKHKLCSNFSITADIAVLRIIDAEMEDVSIDFSTPTARADVKGCTEIQSLGAIHTYLKRYLYLNALEIVENDALDGKVGNEDFKPEPKPPKENKKTIPDDDVEFYLTLDAIEDITTLKDYYSVSKELVKDKNAFYGAVKERQKTIKNKQKEK